jgi:monothiol glutaredoxin
MSAIEDEIKSEIAENKILIYGKGTKSAPQCGFTVETIQFFNKYGYPFEVVNVLENMQKREALSQMTKYSSTGIFTAIPISSMKWKPREKLNPC